MDQGKLTEWKREPAPLIAKTYWKLSNSATMYDVIMVIRADEAHHRDVNHTLADLRSGDLNPYSATQFGPVNAVSSIHVSPSSRVLDRHIVR